MVYFKRNDYLFDDALSRLESLLSQSFSKFGSLIDFHAFEQLDAAQKFLILLSLLTIYADLGNLFLR